MFKSGQPGDAGLDEGSKNPMVRASSGVSLKKEAYCPSGAVSKVPVEVCFSRNADGWVGSMFAIFPSC